MNLFLVGSNPIRHPNFDEMTNKIEPDAVCYICGAQNNTLSKGSDLRPYGKDGAPVCFKCGCSPAHLSITNAEIDKALFAYIKKVEAEGKEYQVGDGAVALEAPFK